MFWFWLTPIFYPLQMVPESYRGIYLLNPMTPYIIFYRSILFDAKIPSLEIIALAFLAALLSLVIGYGVFLKYEALFIKKI
jgi:ABC-type polysaccharide/polyol phosphate export permease